MAINSLFMQRLTNEIVSLSDLFEGAVERLTLLFFFMVLCYFFRGRLRSGVIDKKSTSTMSLQATGNRTFKATATTV